jgi:hypothetical protein
VIKGDYVTHGVDSVYVVEWEILRISYSITVRMLNFKVYIMQSYGSISVSYPKRTMQWVGTLQKKADNNRKERRSGEVKDDDKWRRRRRIERKFMSWKRRMRRTNKTRLRKMRIKYKRRRRKRRRRRRIRRRRKRRRRGRQIE